MKHNINCDTTDNCFGCCIGYIGSTETFLYNTVTNMEYLILED